jgi:hypothetical protein
MKQAVVVMTLLSDTTSDDPGSRGADALKAPGRLHAAPEKLREHLSLGA